MYTNPIPRIYFIKQNGSRSKEDDYENINAYYVQQYVWHVHAGDDIFA